MRLNEGNQTSAYSTTQFTSLNLHKSPEKITYMMPFDPLGDHGHPTDRKLIKNRLLRN